MKICVIGAGNVGLVTALGFANNGHKVVAFDKDEDLVRQVRNGKTPFYEPGLKELLVNNLGQNFFIENTLPSSSNDFEDPDLIFVTVGTPSDERGSIDLSILKNACEEIGDFLQTCSSYTAVIIKSTVIPETTRRELRPIIEENSNGKTGEDFGLCMNPEFLREGRAVENFLHPDRLVIGGFDARSIEYCKRAYENFECPILTTTLESAETIKYVANTFFALLISYSNEIACMTEQIEGVDVEEVLEGLRLDERMTPRTKSAQKIAPGMLNYLRAGCGFGGYCFPKDVSAFKEFFEKKQLEGLFTESVLRINERRPHDIVELVKREYSSLDDRRIGILGLAFKPNTDDIRNSPAIKIINLFLDEGAKVSAYDPKVGNEINDELDQPIELASSAEELLERKEAIVMATAWDEFLEIEDQIYSQKMDRPLLVDGRRLLDKERFEETKYIGAGMGPPAPNQR